MPVEKISGEKSQLEHTTVRNSNEVGDTADACLTDCVQSTQLVYGARDQKSRRNNRSMTATFQLEQTPLKVLETDKLPNHSYPDVALGKTIVV